MTGTVLTDTKLATFQMGGTDYGLIDDGAVAMADGWIVWVGPRQALPAEYRRWPVASLEGRLTTPALVDAHTHLVFAGHRALEFEQRLKGVSYTDIAAGGGGIRSTVEATRKADATALLAQSLPRLDALLAEGVGTVEIKSGYGLDLATERRMLKVARLLPEHRPVRVRATFLGAHAVPAEFALDPDGYIDLVCEEMLPALADDGLVDAVDAFMETIAFDRAQTERMFKAAQGLGLPVKLHADQLSEGGGGELAARFQALSADHLEYLSADGAQAMAAAGCVAVLLPGAFYTLKETQPPPVAALRAAGVPIAVATDCNPGSSPLTSPLLAMNMACTLFGLTPEEALTGMTRIAAAALGIAGEVGTIEAGKRADLAVWDVDHPAELVYRLGFNPLHARLLAGRQ